MSSTFQGQAVFEAILSEAAEKARVKEANALAIEKQRRQELYADAAKRKHFPVPKDAKNDIKKGEGSREKGASYLNPYREYILSEIAKGTKLKDIVDSLGEKGVRTNKKYLSAYISSTKSKEEKQFSLKHRSKLDDHQDYLKEAIAAGKSWSLMSRELQSTRQVTIISHAISEYCKRKGLV